MAIFYRGRWLTAEAVYAFEQPEAFLKYLEPPPESERDEPLRLFEPDEGGKPTTAELYEQSRVA